VQKLDVQIWSDIVCPWCYVGKRRLEAALAEFPHRDRVEISWRAFELDPWAARVRDSSVSYAGRLAEKYRMPVERAEAMIRNMTEVAAADGLDFRFDHIRPGNTFDAHRVLHMAAAHGLGGAAKERLLLAYMTEGASIGEVEVLVRLAGEVGLDTAAVGEMLAGDGYAAAVRRDEEQARAFGIGGVPFFVFDRRYAVSGAQPSEVFLRVLTRVWDELPREPEREPDIADGAVCGPDGCA
jgi:predicted DsbA family dithiol-disulfide isomerase